MRDIGDVWSPESIEQIRVQIDQYRQSYSSSQAGFFLIKEVQGQISVARLQDWDTFTAGCTEDQVNSHTESQMLCMKQLPFALSFADESSGFLLLVVRLRLDSRTLHLWITTLDGHFVTCWL